MTYTEAATACADGTAAMLSLLTVTGGVLVAMLGVLLWDQHRLRRLLRDALAHHHHGVRAEIAALTRAIEGQRDSDLAALRKTLESRMGLLDRALWGGDGN